MPAADTNGDGLSDILWQGTNGQAVVWQMNGTNILTNSAIGPNPGQAKCSDPNNAIKFLHTCADQTRYSEVLRGWRVETTTQSCAGHCDIGLMWGSRAGQPE